MQAQPYPIFLKEDLFILQKKYLTFEEIQEQMSRKVKAMMFQHKLTLKNAWKSAAFIGYLPYCDRLPLPPCVE